MGSQENAESWIWIHQFLNDFSHPGWAVYVQTARNLIAALEGRGLNTLFRIGQSVDHIIISTKEEHGLDGEPHVTFAIDRKEPKLLVAYGTLNLHFSEAQSEETCAADVAVPVVLSYLRRLWIETKPGSPVPAQLAD